MTVVASNKNGSAVATSDPTAPVASVQASGSATGPATSTADTASALEGSATSLQLMVSTSDARTGAGHLNGQTVKGTVYVFTAEGANVTAPVRFFFDEEPDSTPSQVERNAPFDFKGGSANRANPWNTTDVADGTHRIVVVDAAGRRADASFTVENAVQSPAPTPTPTNPGLSFSVSSTRSSPGSLEGRTVEGIVYVFTRDGTNGTPPVRFFPGLSGRVRRPFRPSGRHREADCV